MLDITPLKKPKIFLIGIGGIGMSGIAEILTHQGYEVMGSDAKSNANTARLEAKGLKIFFGHHAQNIANASIIVRSTAIKDNNPEIIHAKTLKIPVLSRAQMLAELMRFYLTIAVSGTHGKTTTTSLIAHLLASLDPTVVNGGIVNAYGSNIRIGNSRWMVVEADESDGTFIRVPASIGVVTNIDPEHLDYYGSFDNLKEAFATFIHQVSFYGFALLCADHPIVLEIIERTEDNRIITYGFHPEAMVRGENVHFNTTGAIFDVSLQNAAYPRISQLHLPMHGEHNVQNALAAIALAVHMGLDPTQIREKLQSFTGVKRRFTITGEVNGIQFIDDYAHHPVEINAVLQAARKADNKRIIAIFQPHRYSRFKQFFQEFKEVLVDVDHLLVTPVWAAGETPDKEINAPAFVQLFFEQAHKHVAYCPTFAKARQALETIAQPGDRVIFFGAGDITKWAYEMPLVFRKEVA